MNEKIIILAEPRGFCAGVERAILIVEKALEIYGAPVYVKHEIVHNDFVVNNLKARGAVFVDEISEIPDGAITVFSAHGVSEKVENEAKLRDLPTIDATCPLVTKVHLEAQKSEKSGNQIIMIGHAGHPEVEGTSGRVKAGVLLAESVEDVKKLEVDNPERVSYITQTTLSVNDTKDIIEALRVKFPKIKGPGIKDICYATQNRQDAVEKLAKMVDLLLVVGSKTSSNSNRLRDYGEQMGTTSYLIDTHKDINPDWLNGVNKIGLTAGASAPEILVNEVIEKIQKLGDYKVKKMDGVEENLHFKLPKEIRYPIKRKV